MDFTYTTYRFSTKETQREQGPVDDLRFITVYHTLLLNELQI